ncbi:MAG TPA: AraC family transcriptional regulator [Kaistia sp.]|nr:AraC family transcriptional regulator [Kaistia sp.]
MTDDFILTEPATNGVQRLVARFGGHAYDPHRHETYAIGVTLSGAQGFRYRGAGRVSRRGQCMVLHPDELHDGRAAAPDGFLYRMVYIEPARIAEALGQPGALPFVGEAVAADPRLADLLTEIYAGFPHAAPALAVDGFLAELAALLAERGGLQTRKTAQPIAAVTRAKALLEAEFDRAIGSADLERVSGMDRFETARHFRRFTGTSPHRYLVGRRLAAAHELIAGGAALSDVAARVGFADQSHMTRAFKARFGMTPGRFRSLVTAGADAA